MALSEVLDLSQVEANAAIVHPAFAARYLGDPITPLQRYRMPDNSMSKEAAYRTITDELMLDGNPRLNMASFVTTWMEPECDELMKAAFGKNFIDMDEYPITTELQTRCVNMIARLFNAPLGQRVPPVGVGTVGSSEAVMLAGLALKIKWKQRRIAKGLPYDNPNFVAGANVQICWKKFATYFDVELREVALTEDCFVMDPARAVELVDENTICVAAILGSTLNGEFEDVERLNNLLVEKNEKTGWDTPIHVDAASGGFIAPFLYPELVWDFRLSLVKSINVSGHKYGLVYPGIGWVIWRSKEDLPKELIFKLNYLGCEQETFTLNFSKASGQIVAQYYLLIRLGRQGYNRILSKCQANMLVVKEGLERTNHFRIVSNPENGVPLVAFSLRDNTQYSGKEFELSYNLRRLGWIVPAYQMPPIENIPRLTVLRVVIREDFSLNLAERLVADINNVLHDLIHPHDPLENARPQRESVLAGVC